MKPHHRNILPFSMVQNMALCLLILLANIFQVAHAGNRIALLIANEDYTKGLNLKNPVNDANLVSAKLKALNYKVTVIKNAEKNELQKSILDFGKNALDAESALFYYSGHGFADSEGSLYMIPVDVANVKEIADLIAQSVNIQNVIKNLESAKPRISVIAYDSNRINPFGETIPSKFSLESNTFISLATGFKSVALDGNGKNSPYATALANELDKAGDISVLSMFKSIKNNVKSETKNEQIPQLYYNAPDDIKLLK